MRILARSWWLLSFLALKTSAGVTVVPIGVLAGPQDSAMVEVLRHSLRTSNATAPLLRLDGPLEFKLVTERLDSPRPFDVTRAVCRLLARGVATVISPASPESQPVLSAYASRFLLPWISPYRTASAAAEPAPGVDLQPGLMPALSSLLRQRPGLPLLYLHDEEPARLPELLEASPLRIAAVARVSSAQHALQHVRHSSASGPLAVLVDIGLPLCRELLELLALQPYGLQARLWLLLAQPVSDDFWKPEYLRLNVTAVRWLNASVIQDFEFRWRHLAGPRLPADMSRALLTLDSARVLVTGLSQLENEDESAILHGPGPLDCMRNPVIEWEQGKQLSRKLRQVVIKDGATGRLQFDSKTGQRTNYRFDIMKTTPLQAIKVGEWSPESGLHLDPRLAPAPVQQDASNRRLHRDKFKVTTFLEKPFMMHVGGEYSGYGKDLLDVLASRLNFSYDIHQVADNKFGSLDQFGRWTGMVGEVHDGVADLAVASLTITPLRSQAVDFTHPFMYSTVRMLLKKPNTDEHLGIFFFIGSLAPAVWVAAVVGYLVLGLVLYGALRLTAPPADRLPPDDGTAGEHGPPSVAAALWFVLGGGLFHSTGIYPKSVSTRVASIVWWIFSLGFCGLYLSSLVAALLGHRASLGVSGNMRSATEILEDFVNTGSPKVGVLGQGSTFQFLKNSQVWPFKQFGQKVEERSELAMPSYAHGLNRVLESDGDFAMLMESMTAEYISLHQPCQTVVAHGSLPKISPFGIALRRGSHLKSELDEVIVELEQSGQLLTLYNKWWKESSECGNGEKQRSFADLYQGALTLSDVGGLFYLLAGAVALVGVLAAGEWLLGRGRRQEGRMELTSIKS